MNKFILNGARIIDVQTSEAIMSRANSIDDNRFAVVNGLLFDLITCEDVRNDNPVGFHVYVCVYDADGCYNASHGDDLIAAYKPANYIVGFEYFVSAEASEDNQLCIDAEHNGEKLFIHLIEHALRDCNNAETRFRNFAIGNDFDHIEGGDDSVNEFGCRYVFAPRAERSETGHVLVDCYPHTVDDWSSDNVLTTFIVNTNNNMYATLDNAHPLTLTQVEKESLLLVAQDID